MKRSIYLLLVVLTALVLSACSAGIGTKANFKSGSEHSPEVIGAISGGP